MFTPSDCEASTPLATMSHCCHIEIKTIKKLKCLDTDIPCSHFNLLKAQLTSSAVMSAMVTVALQIGHVSPA